MSSIVIAGDTSGSVTLQAPAVAGTTTLTLPATSGTVLTTASGTAATATNLAGGSNGTIPYQSASGTTQMLAVGTAGQVLQTNGAGAPTWVTAGSGMTLLSTTTLSGSSTNIGVASGYVHLYIVSYGITFSANVELYFRLNSIAGTGYDLTGTNARSTSVNNNLSDSVWSGAPGMLSRLSSNTDNIDTFFIQNYDSSSMFKIATMTAAYLGSNSQIQFGAQTGVCRNTAAVTGVTFFPNTGTFSGGTVLIYGVK